MEENMMYQQKAIRKSKRRNEVSLVKWKKEPIKMDEWNQ